MERSPMLSTSIPSSSKKSQEESKKTWPIFTMSVSLCHVALLIFTIVENKGFAKASENPLFGPSVITLIRNGAKFVPCMKPTRPELLKAIVRCIPKETRPQSHCTYEETLQYLCRTDILKGFPYQLYRLFTPMFLHGGIIHLFINLYMQMCIGIRMEKEFGFLRISFIYFLSGIGGSLLSSVGLSKFPGVGASGAIFGLYGLYALFLIYHRKKYPRYWIGLLIDAVINIVLTIVAVIFPFIDYLAHAGGLVIGIASSLLVCSNLEWKFCKCLKPKTMRIIIIVSSSLFLLVYFGSLFALFFYMNTEYISNNSDARHKRCHCFFNECECVIDGALIRSVTSRN